MKKIIIAFFLVFLLFSCKDDDMKNDIKDDNGLKSVTINFDTDGGSEVLSVTITYASKLAPVKTEKEGYSFQGWYLDRGFKTQFNFEKPLKAQSAYKDSIILYAKLSQKLYRVTYDGNGNTRGQVPVDDNLYAEGDKFIAAWNGFERPTKNEAPLGAWELIGNVKNVVRPYPDGFQGIYLKEGTYLLWGGSISEITIDINDIKLKARYMYEDQN